ncbi:ROK family protein [Pelagicoccus mobilis]|uniref:ROK family protein n=1 Tax=Pelagicoccus mobilis TaxID=415221 RepID=A0A934S2E5_9BACT|nr:ROK family protein [Pelagicoccus mobilis]MBK1877818.1 ROK family protein [Pelagicoccus mobilis]
MKHYLGIDIGGTKCAVCVGDESANILDRSQIPTTGDPLDILDQLLVKAKSLVRSHARIEAIGISCGGPLDAKQGLILSPPNLPGWNGIAVTQFFKERLGVHAYLQNDANAGALAEWRHGAGRGSQHMMFCTMGTGFGSGLILNGELLDGANGNAGEIGHLRLTGDGPLGYGKSGSVEGWCGGSGIAQVAKRMADKHRERGSVSSLFAHNTLSAKLVAEAALQGDDLALNVFDHVGQKLGRTLAIAIDLLNLDTIVIGSIFARCETLIRPAMERVLAEECLPHSLEVCTVKPAALDESIGDIAAITVAQLGPTL